MKIMKPMNIALFSLLSLMLFSLNVSAKKPARVKTLTFTQSGKKPTIVVEAIGNKYAKVSQKDIKFYYNAQAECNKPDKIHYFSVFQGVGLDPYWINEKKGKDISDIQDIVIPYGYTKKKDKAKLKLSHRAISGPLPQSWAKSAINLCNDNLEKEKNKNYSLKNILSKNYRLKYKRFATNDASSDGTRDFYAYAMCGAANGHEYAFKQLKEKAKLINLKMDVLCKKKYQAPPHLPTPKAKPIKPIKPKQPSKPFKITHISAGATTKPGSCPKNIILKAGISASAKGETSYYWRLTSDNGVGSRATPIYKQKFSAASNHVFSKLFKVNKSQNMIGRLYVTNPVKMVSKPFNLKIECNASNKVKGKLAGIKH